MTDRARIALALIKPGITGMALFMAAGSLLMAPERMGTARSLVALAGITLLVGAANAFNQVMERNSDGLMERTRGRPLPSGRLATRAAIAIASLLAVAAFVTLWFSTNLLTVGLSLLAMILYVLVYTPLKYKTTSALLIGAVPGAMPALLGWTAATGRIDPFGAGLFLILFVWQIPHFLAISLFPKDEYAKAGIHVVPNRRGDEATRREQLAYTLALLPVSLALVPLGAGAPYLVMAVLGGALLLALAVAGLKPSEKPWPRRYFLATLLYLPMLIAGLAIQEVLA